MSQVDIQGDLFAGDAFLLPLTLENPDGTPHSLVGSTIVWNLFPMTGAVISSTPLLTKGIGTGITVVDQDAGQVIVSIDAGEVPDVGVYFHKLTATEVGSTSTYVDGRFLFR
jgi:hypothetical protein